ncbi:MAG: helix-turn-helix transcriptional regulator [Neglectibacter timonensis]
MQNEHETLGEIIKNARIKADITVEDLAAKVGVTERFIYRIENEGKKPSYDILYKLIRELSILPDQIFFPEKQIEDSEMESLVRMLYNCDERSMQIIKRQLGGLGQPAQRVKKSRCPWEISQVHRLCVYASGSLMTTICSCFA